MIKTLPSILAGLIALWVVSGWIRSAAARFSGLPKGVLFGDSIAAGPGVVQTLNTLGPIPWSSYAVSGLQAARIAGDVHSADIAGRNVAVVLAGVNDINSGAGTNEVVESLSEVYRSLKARGLHVVAVSLTPWAEYRSISQDKVATWANVNRWIVAGAGGLANSVVNTAELGDGFGRLLPQYDAGDHLHLSPAGQQKLGNMIKRQAFGR